MTDPLEGVPSPVDPAAQQAKARFVLLQAIRFAGVAMAVVGMATIAGKLPLPVEAGYGLVVAGVIDALFVPIVLSRAWKSARR